LIVAPDKNNRAREEGVIEIESSDMEGWKRIHQNLAQKLEVADRLFYDHRELLEASCEGSPAGDKGSVLEAFDAEFPGLPSSGGRITEKEAAHQGSHSTALLVYTSERSTQHPRTSSSALGIACDGRKSL
jgi:hypothetical protein